MLKIQKYLQTNTIEQLKEELYLEHIEPYYNVRFVLDDRPSVVRNCWNKLGLFVFKVGREFDF